MGQRFTADTFGKPDRAKAELFQVRRRLPRPGGRLKVELRRPDSHRSEIHRWQLHTFLLLVQDDPFGHEQRATGPAAGGDGRVRPTAKPERPHCPECAHDIAKAQLFRSASGTWPSGRPVQLRPGDRERVVMADRVDQRARQRHGVGIEAPGRAPRGERRAHRERLLRALDVSSGMWVALASR